jgi:ankyrin repeat protein
VPIDIPMNDQSSALDLAVFGGHLAAVSLLAHRQDAAAASSADAMGRNQSDWRSRRNDHQCTVAHWAGMGGSMTVIAWLLRHGCRFDAVQKENQSPLHKAAGKKNFNALAAIATALLLPLAAASRVGGSDETVLLLDRIRAAIGGSTGVAEDGGSPRTLELAACPACEADAAAPGRISLADLPCGRSAESMIDETRQLFALRDTSGLCARDVALAQGMSADHAAFAILSVFDL